MYFTLTMQFVSDTVRYHAAIKLANISVIATNENINEFLQQKISKYVSTKFYFIFRNIRRNHNAIDTK